MGAEGNGDGVRGAGGPGVIACGLLAGALLVLASAYIQVVSQMALLAHLCEGVGVGLLVAASVGWAFQMAAARRLARSVAAPLEAQVARLEGRLGSQVQELEGRLGSQVDQFEAQVARLEGRLGSQVQELEGRLGSQVDQLGEVLSLSVGTFKIGRSKGITNMYPDRGDHACEERLLQIVSNARGRVDIVGISLGEFLTGGGGARTAETFRQRVTADPAVTVRLLMASPEGEGLRERAMWEHPGQRFEGTLAHTQTSHLVEEAQRLRALSGGRLELKLYRTACTCWLVMSDLGGLVEFYTFEGRGGRNFILEFKPGSELWRTYEVHFDRLWASAEEPPEEPAAAGAGR
jgi:hypothetical protein